VCFDLPLYTGSSNCWNTKRATCCVLFLTKPTKGEITVDVKEKLMSDYDKVVTEVAEATSAMF
jgi:H/ACA ribonucleoprotein complex subunit 2